MGYFRPDFVFFSDKNYTLCNYGHRKKLGVKKKRVENYTPAGGWRGSTTMFQPARTLQKRNRRHQKHTDTSVYIIYTCVGGRGQQRGTFAPST